MSDSTDTHTNYISSPQQLQLQEQQHLDWSLFQDNCGKLVTQVTDESKNSHTITELMSFS